MCRVLRWFVLVVVAVVIVGAILYWRTPPYLPWLEVQERLDPAPVIVVLNGENQRADEAAAIFHARYGREIWLTNDPKSGSATIADAGTDENLRRLENHRIPPEAIRVLPEPASSTKAEIRQIATELRRHNIDHVILITSKLHTRRTRILWGCVVGKSPAASIHSPPATDYIGADTVRREILKVAAARLCIG